MNKINSNFESYLPLNRKERYFTGTVFPQIVCFDNFKHINRFLNLINGFPKNIEVKPDIKDSNIQFFTEYSLNESANFDDESIKYSDVPSSKETPDIVILITEPELYLILVEVKMYSSIGLSDFAKQLDNQRIMLDCIRGNLKIKPGNVFHVGLVPESMFTETAPGGYQILHWENILREYKDLLSDNYFYNVLQTALTKYNKLKSQTARTSHGKNMETKLTGMEILDEIKGGRKFIISRNRGLNGPEFTNDINTGEWKTFSYEVNFSKLNPINKNWFTSLQFYSKVSRVMYVSPKK